jgi:Ferritin-like domain
MPDHIQLEVLDRDGAIQQAAEAVGVSRADFFKRAGVAGAGFVAGGVLLNGLVSPAEAAIATRHRSKRNDTRILNYALTLEYLEAAFYRQALVHGGAQGDEGVKFFATYVAQHEAAHVKTLKHVLGSAAVAKPTFDFGEAVTNLTKFKQTAQVLEDTGVAAYAGQGPNLLQRPLVQAALSIHSVEARHAAWIRFINGGGQPGAATEHIPAPKAFDSPKTEKTVLKAVKATGFIAG